MCSLLYDAIYGPDEPFSWPMIRKMLGDKMWGRTELPERVSGVGDLLAERMAKDGCS